MYYREEFDSLFYRMKKNIPSHKILFMIVSVIKLYPLFLLVHSGGFLEIPDPLSTFHKYFTYFSMSYYIQNSFTAQNILLLISIVTFINILLIGLLIYYIISIKKHYAQQYKYSNRNSLSNLFSIFSNAAFFKYIILFQFFFEINSLPLICIPKAIDIPKLRSNKIYSNIDSFILTQNDLCHGSKLYLFCLLAGFNIVTDILFYWIITSRFFDYNILSTYKWNFYPNLIFSFEFLESCTQAFLILFLNYHPKTYRILLSVYVCIIFIVNFFQYLNQNTFCTAYTYTYVYISDYIRLMCYVSSIINTIFYFGFDAIPNDVNVIEMLIFEFISVYMLMKLLYNKEKELVKKILVSSLNNLNEKNIYVILIVLIKEFKTFSDVSCKFSDKTLDIFLENYVNHLKLCEDRLCPCKNYVKKITGTSNTIKSGYTTVINFVKVKKDQQEEYILNKFFNVLSSNIGGNVKHTSSNINVNNMKEDQRQKLICQFRIKLIRAVKSLIIYRLEKLTKDLNGALSSHFSNKAKDFIRINYFALNVFSNKAYFKTQFLYQDYLSNLIKLKDRGYQSNMIYYLYLKMFCVKEYNDNISVSKQTRKKHSHLRLDLKMVLSLCVKYYEIEDHLINTTLAYVTFVSYYSKDQMVFNVMLEYINKLKSSYKAFTEYTNYHFKNEKINNLFICTKIILFYKVIHFDISESLHNKLIIQSHENDQSEKSHSNDSNYFIILSYSQGEFVIKFISHELLLVLDYSEDELKNKEFDILLPYKLRKLHKNVLISEIKTPKNTNSSKEVFLISKGNICILADLQYKFLLNPKGDITLLSIVNVKKSSTKDYRTAFICIDDHGNILALNKEFEEYMILSMKMLDYIKIDTEKLILQNNGQRMRNYFKEDENTGFQENFDYEVYLSSLFDEEFDSFKEKDEREYNRKKARWELLKETNRKGRYYTRYLELNIKQRIINNEVLFFIKYNLKLTVSLRSVEPHSTTLSLIHAVKISKREMAKLSFYRGESLYEYRSDQSSNEDKANESQDDIFESQSQISSAVTQLKERNTIRLFHQKANYHRFSSRRRNLLWLMISIAVFGGLSVLTNMIMLIFKTKLHNTLYDYFILRFDTLVLKKGITTLSSALVSMSLYQEISMNDSKKNNDYLKSIYDLIERESELVNEISYNISVKNSKFFSKKIDSLTTKKDVLNYIFRTGQMYSKTVVLIQEILNLNKQCQDSQNRYSSLNSNTKNLFENYYFMNRIAEYQANLTQAKIVLDEIDMSVYFVLNNIFEILDKYIDEIIVTFERLFISKLNSTLKALIIIKIVEVSLICFVIGIEWLFVNVGYDQAKKKMMSLQLKLERNDIEMTINKLMQFIHFSNAFDINSLYYIADLDLRKVKESTKTLDLLQLKNSGSGIAPVLNSKETNKTLTPRKRTQTLNIFHDKDIISLNKPKSKTIELNKDERDMMIGLGVNNSSKNNRGSYEKEIIDNKNSNINNNTKEGKKNLLNVINKLNQIKGVKVNSIEKKVSDPNNNTNNDILNDLLFEPNIKEQKNKTDIRIDNYNKDMQSSIDIIQPIKSVLKISNKNNQDNTNTKECLGNNNSSIISNNNHNESNSHDETKSPMIKPNEEGKSLIKKNTRTTKVQFKEKNVRYYCPVQNVNEANESSNHKIGKEHKDVVLEEPNSRETTQIPASLLNALQQNNNPQLTIETKYKDGKSKSNNANSLSLQKKDAKSNITLVEIKDGNINGLSKYNLIDQGKAVTVKKIMDPKNKNMPSKEMIANKIDKVVYKSKYARVILNIALAVFVSLYLSSMLLNYDHHVKINNASLYGALLVNKASLYKISVFKYQISIIKGLYYSDITDFISKTEENKKQLIDFESSKYMSIFPLVKSIEESYHRNDSCRIFAENYSKEFKTNPTSEYDTCMSIGGQMNINGFKNAETYLLSTIIMFINDWKNKISQIGAIDNNVIKHKLTSDEYSNIIFEMDGVLRKNQLIIIKYFIHDTEEIIKNILKYERILGYLSVGLDTVFLVLSMAFIVYPIKSVEKLISWVINKLITT